MWRICLAAIPALIALTLAGGLTQSHSEPMEYYWSSAPASDLSLRLTELGGCGVAGNCGHLAGDVSPASPPSPVPAGLPEVESHNPGVQGVQAAFQYRRDVLSPRVARTGEAQPAGLSPSELDLSTFVAAVMRLNGDIFWAPASKSTNVITRFGDEARAVFGPIPDGDCSGDGARSIPVQVEGNIVDLKPNSAIAGSPLAFEHRDYKGNVVKWTDSIPKCDKPSLAGNVTYCGLNSRLSRVVKGNVEWLFFCRKSSASLEVVADPYWLRSNPKFARYGVIGFNRRSGEIVFFDGRKDRAQFDWSRPFVPPGGRSYSDRESRAAAEEIYDPTFQIQCSMCHDNKKAYVIDPHAEQWRVGYSDGPYGERAMAFSLGDYLPESRRDADAPFRVVGTGYTSKYRVELARAKTVRDPAGKCTGCHTLTTQVTGQRFAADAVAREPWVSYPSWAQLLALRDEKSVHAQVAAHRTDWALRSGAGKIHPWMLPGYGNELSPSRPEISDADWRQLSNCLWEAGGAECGYQPLYTACPAPESGAQGDASKAEDFAVDVLAPRERDSQFERVIRVSWRYLNLYGGIPERDDVRFNVAIKETDIPRDGRPPSEADYPSLEEARDENYLRTDGETGYSASTRLIRNVAYAGHEKWTEPVVSTDLRHYRVTLPGVCDRRYLMRVRSKRFCFDQSNIAYGNTAHVLYADVRCD